MLKTTQGTSRSEIFKDDDHVYYNVTIEPFQAGSIPQDTVARFLDNRADPIIDIPEEYHLSIIRFSIPAENIPIFIYPKLGTDGSYTPDNFYYSVTLSTGGNDYRQYVTYVPCNNILPSTTITYYYVFSYTRWLDMVNTALSLAFTALKTANPGVAATRAPYLLYDETTHLVNLIVQKVYVGSIDVYMNTKLYDFFDSFNVIYGSYTAANGKEVQIIIQNTLNNCFSECPVNLVIGTTNASPTITSAGLFTINLDGSTVSAPGIPLNTTATFVNANTMTLSSNATATATVNAIFTTSNLLVIRQEYPVLYLWNDLKSIVVTSGAIPTKEEYTSVGQGSNNSFQKILTDFEPDIESGTDSKSVIQYLPTAEYRRVDLKGRVPLTTIDLQFYWKTVYQELLPISLVPFSNCITCKILFEKKQKYSEITNYSGSIKGFDPPIASRYLLQNDDNKKKKRNYK